MASSSRLAFEMIRELAHEDARRRESAADKVTDLSFVASPEVARLLAGVLALAAAQERDSEALEAQLNALLQLSEFLDPDMATHLGSIDLEAHPTALRAYVHDLLEGLE
ncbi:hypothetical protein [Streptomyces sp. PvR034]|uniref:hypothetical protein n=1 Tax=Streptomyces sp. PvR034 TaxID=3156401 RepID=UPI003396F463